MISREREACQGDVGGWERGFGGGVLTVVAVEFRVNAQER